MTSIPELSFDISAISGHQNSDPENEFPASFFSMLRANGLLKLTFRENPNADGPYTGNLLTLLKAIGRKNLSGGRIFEGHINALQLVDLYAQSAQRLKWFNDVQEQKLFGVWNTQADAGLKIVDQGNGLFILDGTKTYCSGANFVERPLITAEWVSPNFKGWQMMIIPVDKVKPISFNPDSWQPMGMKASVSYRMDFSGIELTAVDLLGQPGDYYKQPHFSGGAIRFSAVQLGGAEAIFAEVHSAMKAAGRSGDPFQKARIAEMMYLVETGNLWLSRAAELTDAYPLKDADPNKLVAYVNMSRSVVEDICLKVMQLAERSMGSRAFLHTSPLERLHRDLTTYLRQPGPDAALTAVGTYAFEQRTVLDLWKGANEQLF